MVNSLNSVEWFPVWPPARLMCKYELYGIAYFVNSPCGFYVAIYLRCIGAAVQ